MTLDAVATTLKDDGANVILVYAFNSTGKTRLCVKFKDATKTEQGDHTGVYYNAFSEDLFSWDNDEENDGSNIKLNLRPSSLNRFHASLTEDNIREKLKPYNLHFGFSLKFHADPSHGIESISFFVPNQNPDAAQISIKISRGEERIFVWCFFLALFEVEAWADAQSSHLFIDDPVSSLDDHNIFVTASTIFDLVDEHFGNRKIIVTTHHLGLYSILKDLLMRGEKSGKFKGTPDNPKTKAYILRNTAGTLSLEKDGQEVLLYHLRLLQILMKARMENQLRAFHFVLLRQVLENVAAFSGRAQFGFVLNRIGITEQNQVANLINTMSHKKIFTYESNLLQDETRTNMERVLDKLQETYRFELQVE